MANYSVPVRELIKITKALADPNRVRILLALRGRELCVCQVVELLELAPSTISRHLSVLNHAGLTLARKDERWVYYRLPDRSAPVVIREAVDWVQDSLRETAEARADAKSLKQILRLKPSDLCQRQNVKRV